MVADFQKFPHVDLKTIDQLWVRASQRRYGFSIQKEIYVKCVGNLDGRYPGNQIWHEFCEKIDWGHYDDEIDSWVYHRYNDLDLDGVSETQGHLPGVLVLFASFRGWSEFSRILGEIFRSHQEI